VTPAPAAGARPHRARGTNRPLASPSSTTAKLPPTKEPANSKGLSESLQKELSDSNLKLSIAENKAKIAKLEAATTTPAETSSAARRRREKTLAAANLVRQQEQNSFTQTRINYNLSLHPTLSINDLH